MNDIQWSESSILGNTDELRLWTTLRGIVRDGTSFIRALKHPVLGDSYLEPFEMLHPLLLEKELRILEGSEKS